MAPKNVALMYISEVSGHRNAALAVERALRSIAPETNILNINAFRYTNPISEQVVNQIYTAIIKRTPKIWDLIYDNPAVKKRLDMIKNVIHKLNSPKFRRLFEKFHPDIVVCTQAFPCGMVADYKRLYGHMDLPLIAVLTDYVPHSYWLYDEIDYYVVPSEEVAQRLHKKGVPMAKIKPLGIPFDHKFNAPVDSAKVYAQLGFNPAEPTVLIMGGGQGLGPIKTIVKSLEKVKQHFQLIVVCGTNKKLYRSLKKRVKKSRKTVRLFGYVNNINELMSISSMVITKPGGITTSEALTKKLPMLIIKPIPGQEENNTVYLTQQNAAVRVTEPEQINRVVEQLLNDRAKLKKIADAAGRLAKPDASMDTARLILDLA